MTISPTSLRRAEFMNLNVETWKEFRLTDIFTVKGGFYNKKPEHSIDGHVPFLASTESNNGVTEYYSLEDIKAWDKVGNPDDTLDNKIFNGNCIAVTVNGSVCNAFYQNKDFTCSHDITVLYPKNHELTQLQAIFICAVIMKEKYRWSYGRKPHDVKKFGRSIIKLPINQQGNIDWNYMEQYVKTLKYKPITTTNCQHQASALNIGLWKPYKVSEIFTIRNGTGITKEEIECNPGDFIAVQSGEENNACIGKIDKNYCIRMGYTYTDEPCLTVARSGSAGFVSYQPFGCVVGDSAKILSLKDNEHKNAFVFLFLKTILMANKYKYTYGRKVTEDKYLSEMIMLPAAEDNKPDYVFMENYIKSLPYGDRL